MLSREEILAVYEAGPEAVVALVERLLAEQSRLFQQVQMLTTRVQELESRLNKDSHNSHKPPSSDGLAKLPQRRSRRKRSGKASGGQAGHVGFTLQPVAEPNEIVAHAPQVCPACQTGLETAPRVIRERRQVFELPPLQPVVIEHQLLQVICPQCQAVAAGQFPLDVTQPTQYGPGVKALAVYLQEYQQIPMARTQEFFTDVLQLPLSEGTLAHARETCAVRLEGVETAIKQGVTQSAVVNFDETGTRIEGKTRWQHVASTPALTYYAVQARRGRIAMNAIGILPDFKGTAVHDALHAYFPYACAHSLCNAHLLRDLTAASEMTRQRWPQQMVTLLLDIKAAVERARAASQTQLAPRPRTAFLMRYDHLIRQGFRSNPPLPARTRGRGRQREGPRRNLLLRLKNHAAAVLAFMHNFQVPFDNNQAERDLRMVRVRQKISGGFRSWRGAEIFCTIRGYLSTMRKQGQNVLAALNSVFTGNPTMPRLIPK
jgi:transposase